MTRRLVLMRHAKAEPYADTDFVRALTPRGLTDAEEAGRYLVGVGRVPDLALVSTARRCRQTWDQVRAGSASTAEAQMDQELYASQPEVMLEMLRLVEDEHATVLLVAHNPGLAYLAYLLDDGEGDPEVVRNLLEGLPPAALAIFEIEGSWATLSPGGARITHFHVGGS